MSPNGSDGRIGFDLDSWLGAKEDRIQQHLRPIGWGLFILSVVSLVAWFVTVMVFPAADVRRERLSVPLKDQRTIVVDYPVRFLADDVARPIYLTTDSRDSFSVILELPSSLSLIMVSAEPSSTVKIEDPAKALIAVTWPTLDPPVVSPSSTSGATSVPSPTSTATPVSQGTSTATVTGAATPTVLIPLLGQPGTITLQFKNAGMVKGIPLIPFIATSANASLTIRDGDDKIAQIPLQIETTAWASWRSFAKNYSFLAVLPFLISAFGFLTKTYIDYRKSKKEDANKALQDLLQAIARANESAIAKNEKLLKQLDKYVLPDDLNQTWRILQFSRRELVSPIDVEEFKAQPEVWVGALCLAANHLSQSSDQPPIDQTSASDAQTAPADENSRRFKTELYRLVRVFPVDILSPEAEDRLRTLRKDLGFSNPQTHDWPPLAEAPKPYPEPLTDTTTIEAFKLFPSETGDALSEVDYLFSKHAWYWREHPLYVKLKAYLQPVLVCGDVGSGRTALALALTGYAKRDEKVLGSYHDQPVSLAQSQEALSRVLLQFISQLPTLLSNLTRDDRDLLVSVLLSVLDDREVLSAVSSEDSAQITALSDSDKANLPLWQAQAKVEFRLLSDSARRMTRKTPLPEEQWFKAFSLCAKKLGFKRTRIALDLKAEDFDRWCCDHLGQFRSAIPFSFSFPVQLFVFVPSSTTDLDGAKQGLTLQQLQWRSEESGASTDYLRTMLEYRYEQRTGSTRLPDIEGRIPKTVRTELCIAAEHNPRHLAALWNEIATKFSEQKGVTLEMVGQASANVEGP